VITGTGSYIPEIIRKNSDFANQKFFSEDNSEITIEPHIIIDKFQKITGIAERRYVSDDLNTSDIAALAGKKSN
jgi:3-oxoacyl-[acyl-carrier-protein] synthase-3